MEVKERAIVTKDLQTVGIRMEIWTKGSTPLYSDRFCSCDMSDSQLAQVIQKKYSPKSGNALFVKVVDGVYVSNDERDSVEIESIQEFNKYYKKAELHEKKLEEFIKSVEPIIEKFKNRLKNEGIKMPYRDEVEISDCELSVRFLGGMSAWSGGYGDICDADRLTDKVGLKIESIVRKFEKENKVKIAFSTGEKAWSYFEFSPAK